MSIFKNLFKPSVSSSEEKKPKEESLNELLLKMDKEYYKDECPDFPEKAETAFDVIALLSGLNHSHDGIYKDKDGHRYIKTKFGFMRVTAYGKQVEYARLRDSYTNTISELKSKRDNLIIALANAQEGTSKKQAQEDRHVMKHYSRIEGSKEVALIINKLELLDSLIKNAAEDKKLNYDGSFYNLDLENPEELKRKLIHAGKLNDNLKSHILKVNKRILNLRRIMCLLLKKEEGLTGM